MIDAFKQLRRDHTTINLGVIIWLYRRNHPSQRMNAIERWVRVETLLNYSSYLVHPPQIPSKLNCLSESMRTFTFLLLNNTLYSAKSLKILPWMSGEGWRWNVEWLTCWTMDEMKLTPLLLYSLSTFSTYFSSCEVGWIEGRTTRCICEG